MFVHFKGNNNFTLLLIQISFRFANDNNYYVFFCFYGYAQFQFIFYVSDVYLCSAHTCYRAGRQLKTEQRSAWQNGKQSTKKEQREKQSGREQKQKSVWERVLGHSLPLSLSGLIAAAAAFCFFDVRCFVYKYRLVNKC